MQNLISGLLMKPADLVLHSFIVWILLSLAWQGSTCFHSICMAYDFGFCSDCHYQQLSLRLNHFLYAKTVISNEAKTKYICGSSFYILIL